MGEFFVYSFFLGTLMLLFPIFTDVDVYLDAYENRGWFSLSLYHVLRLFGGYAQLRSEGLVFHLTKKKAVILPYSGMADARKKFEVTKGFQFMRFHQIIETGGAQNAASALLASVFFAIDGTAYAILHEKYPFLSIRNVAVLHHERCLKGCIRITAVMNGLVLVVALTKKILEEMIKWMKKRKSMYSWKKLQKNLRASSM